MAVNAGTLIRSAVVGEREDLEDTNYRGVAYLEGLSFYV